jgi:hypothetical protein
LLLIWLSTIMGRKCTGQNRGGHLPGSCWNIIAQATPKRFWVANNRGCLRSKL